MLLKIFWNYENNFNNLCVFFPLPKCCSVFRVSGKYSLGNFSVGIIHMLDTESMTGSLVPF